MRPNSDDDHLHEILLRCEELREQGTVPSVEELCHDCPELIGRVRRSLAALERMAWLDDRVSSTAAAGAVHSAEHSECEVEPTDFGGNAPCQGEFPAPLRELGDYRVLAPIGAGGMGRIYKAIHRHMERVVALKVVREEAVASPQAIARFHQEMKAAAMLVHPNIVTAHDAGEDRGICYLVMEFVDGCDLTRLVREKGPLPIEQAGDYAIQAARGLAYAHDKGLTHRDIKPANLLLDRNGTVKVLDLGLARLRERDCQANVSATVDLSPAETQVAGELPSDSPGTRAVPVGGPTQSGRVRGTLAYMAPEQMDDPGAADHRADIYSLGCTLYFLLTGELLHRFGAGATDPSARRLDVVAALRQRRPEVPKALANVVATMAACQPDERYSSMEEVIAALQKALANVSTPASRRARWRMVAACLATFGLAGLAALGWVAFEIQGECRAEALERRLLAASPESLPRIVAELAPYRRWLDRRLRADYDRARSQNDLRSQLNASLGLLPVDSRQVDFLFQHMLIAEAAEFPVICQALTEHRWELIEPLWDVWQNREHADRQRYRAAAALARYASGDTRWSLTTSGELAVLLVAEPAQDLEIWTACFRPIREHLEPHLRVNFLRQDRELAEPAANAAHVLASWFADEPEKLVELLLDSSPAQFAILAPTVQRRQEQTMPLLKKVLEEPIPPAKDARRAWSRRQAASLAILFRFGQEESVWPALRQSGDPTVRSGLIHRLGPSGADPERLVSRLNDESDESVRQALILALGEFLPGRLQSSLRESLVKKLGHVVRDDPDPATHGAAEWLLRQWGQPTQLAMTDSSPVRSEGERAWYINGQGQTMVVVPGPTEFTMGTSTIEPGSQSDELLRPVVIPRSFAISAKEVTVVEFAKFLEDHPSFRVPETDQSSERPDHPQTHLTWQAAVAYCRWLSQKEGVAESDQCYPPVSPVADELQLPADFLARPAYRLATEVEWEYACRAGTITSRFYGESDDLLDEYGWSSRGRTPAGTQAVGIAKPNDLGIFDLYGNVMEWCHHAADDDWPDISKRPGAGAIVVYPADRFRLRGASHRNRPSDTHSARRFQYKPGRMLSYLGLRLARTVPTRSLAVIPRGQPLWGKAEFLVQGTRIPFVVTNVQGNVEVSPTSGTTPACIRVVSPDGRARPFSLVVERGDSAESRTVHGIAFSSDWEVKFYSWDTVNRDERSRPGDWERMTAGPPIEVHRSTELDFDWGVGAPDRGVPRDYFAMEATTTLQLPAGKYQLWASADNGLRVFVDGIQRMDFNVWLPGESSSNLVELSLAGGEHSFRVQHYECRDQARARLGLRPLN